MKKNHEVNMTNQEFLMKKEFMALEIVSTEVVNQSQEVKFIENEQEQKYALKVLGNIRKTRKEIDGKRKAVTKEARAFTSDVNEKAKEMMEPLQELESKLEQMIFAYTTNQIELKGEDYSFSDPVVRSNGTSMFIKEKGYWEVEDISKVPREYLKLDEKKIDQAVDFGIEDIEGIKIRKKLTSQVRVV